MVLILGRGEITERQEKDVILERGEKRQRETASNFGRPKFTYLESKSSI